MTGRDVTMIRERLELDPFAFAAVIGVHVSTIYRWETNKSVNLDPLQREILEALAAKKISKAEGADLGKRIRDGLVAGGSLKGLLVLLTFITKKED